VPLTDQTDPPDQAVADPPGVHRSALLAEVVRSGFVEGAHRGSVVALGADGAELWRLGDPDRPVFPRSSNKPMQAAGMLRAGLELDGELLALASASHSGEPFHVDGVRRILAGAGLDESALQTPPDLPIDEPERARLLAAGTRPAPIYMNCSGKHAAMLATCVAAGWPTATYRDPDHPLQQALRETVEDLTGEKVSATGVDGCGAPVFALSLTGLARAFQRLALAEPAAAEGRVAAAIRAHPSWLGGTRRDVTALVAGIPGLLAKDGAEAVYAAALPDGRAVALKVDDGGQRARPPVMAAALRRLGVTAAVLDEQLTAPLLGGGAQVGDVRPVF
jgi:L-asparaginase II